MEAARILIIDYDMEVVEHLRELETTNEKNADQKPPSADRQAILQRYLGPPENTFQMLEMQSLTWLIFYDFEIVEYLHISLL